MNINGSKILSELTEVNNQLNTSDIYKLIDLIDISNHIYLTGAGRSGLMIRSFANRLLHLGYNISVVGEISSPHTHPGDLLLISSGSGETKSLISQAEIAKQNGLKVALKNQTNETMKARHANLE